MSGTLSGKAALVTGASRGLGRAMAISLASSGAAVALVARDREKLAEARREIEAAGGRAVTVAADLTDEADVARAVESASAELGTLQILVNNAGINIRKNIVDFSLEEWRSVMDSNHTSAFLMCRAVVPQMRAAGWGRVINIASTMAHVSIAMRGAYSSSKAALLGLTRALALELAAENITVNSVSPGPVATEINRAILDSPEWNAQFLTNVPMGRWGTPEEISSLVCYLCSPAAGFVTGADFLVDGGWCAR